MMEGLAFQADKALLDTVFDGVAVVDLKSLRISLANKAAAKILGFNDPEELAGVDPLKHIPQEDAAHVSSLLSSVLSGVCLQEGIEVRVLDKRGKEIWITARGVKLASNGSSVLLATFRDVTAQKVAEMAKREAERNQLELLDISNEMILISQDWKVVFGNRCFQQAMGLSEEALTGMSILDLTHPDDREAVAKRYQKILEGRYLSSDRPFRGIGKGGRTGWGIMRHVPFTWHGKPALMTIVQDITQQKVAEEALQESEKRYRLITENITDVIWALDMNLNTIYVSPSVLQQKGYTVEEAMSLTLEEQMSPDTVAQIKSAILEEMLLEESGNADPHRSRTAEGETYRKDGSKFWVEVTASFLRDPQGKPIGFMGVTRDITERKKAEENLRRSEEFSRRVIESSNDCIKVLDLQGNLLSMSAGGQVLMEIDDIAPYLNRSWVDFWKGEDREAALEVISRAKRGDAGIFRGYCETAKGAPKWWEVIITPIRDAHSDIDRLLSVSRDITERKKAEVLLRASEEKYRLLTEKTKDIIWTTDLTLRSTYVSPSIKSVLGFTPEERLKQPIEAQMTPASYARVQAHLEEELRREQEGHYDPERTIRVETEYYHKNGSTVWMENLVSAIRDQEGHIVGVHGVSRDVTDRRQAEESAKLAAQEWGETFDSITDMVSIHDRDFNVVRANKAFSESLGLKPDEVKGRKCYEVIHGTEVPWPACPHQKCMTCGESCTEEVWEPRLLRYLHVSVSPLFNSRNEVVGSVHIARDVTERKKAEEALADSERRYRLLAENIDDVIYTTDLNLNINYVSSSIIKLLGYRPEEILNTRLDKLVTPASLEAGMTVAAERLAKEATAGSGADGKWTVELELVCRDGGTVWVEVTTNFVRGQDGRAIGLTGMVRDISERKRAQDALRATEANYRNLFEQTLMGMEVVDAETMKVVLANHSMARMFGFKSSEDMVGTAPLDYVLPEDLGWVTADLARVMASPDMYETATLRSRTEDGRVIWVTGMTTQFLYEGSPSVLISLVDVTAAKEAELKVAESEEKNRLLIDNAAEGIAVVQDGLLKFANRKFAESVGYSAEELISRSFADFIHADDLPRIADYYVKRLKGEEAPSKYQFRWIDREGAAHWGEASVAIFKWEGRPAILCMLTDITDRKRAEDSLRESETRYRLIAENSSDVIWTMDMGLRMTYVSPSIEKLTGYTAEESMSKRMEEGLTSASLETAAAAFAKGLADLERNGGNPTSPETMDLEMKRKDGSTVWTEVQVSFMQDPDGKVVGIMGLARDIDERRRARKALEESEERFRALIEGARDAIAVIDLNGKVTYRSPSAERITEGAAENLLTTNLQEKLHPDDVDKATSIFESLTKGPNGSVVDVELRYRRSDESWGVVEARGTNLVHDPKIRGIVVNYRDITERRQAEEALRESESRYRLLAENVSDVIWSLDMKSRRVFLSRSITRLLGYTVEEATSLKMKEVVAPTSYASARMAFSKLSAQQANGSNGKYSSTQVEVELMRKDGSFVWVDISVTLVRNVEGQPAEVFGVIRDVTQRKKVEEALRTSEEYFRALIENAWDAIVIVDAEGTMLYESPSSARILGYEPEELVGKNLAEFVRPEDVAAIADTFRKFRTEPGSIVMVDAGFRHKDGHYIECEGTLQNFLQDPKINGVVANYRDVTDRRRAEEAIRTSEERFRNLVEATSDWVWEVDPNGIYTYVSPKVREVMGYEIGEIIGKSIFDLMPARESSRFARTFRAHAEKREPFAFLETSRQRKDGRVIVVETSGVPFFGEDGGLLGYRGIGRDITNRKKVEKDLENSLKKVEKTMEAAIQAISYTMETRDPYTTGHQRRVTQLACAIAKEMGVAPWQIDGIRVAGLLHDIGKIAVPTEILSKPGKLSDIEFSMIKAHPKVGFDILKNVEFEWPIARIVVQHHERLDGSGYPFGLQGRDILQESRILAVADVVEAMSSHRPYRPALGIDKALAEVVRGDGTLYDPEVVRACSKVIKERGFKFEG